MATYILDVDVTAFRIILIMWNALYDIDPKTASSDYIDDNKAMLIKAISDIGGSMDFNNDLMELVEDERIRRHIYSQVVSKWKKQAFNGADYSWEAVGKAKEYIMAQPTDVLPQEFVATLVEEYCRERLEADVEFQINDDSLTFTKVKSPVNVATLCDGTTRIAL